MKPQKKKKSNHYCLIVNKSATNYNSDAVKRMTKAIKQVGDSYTVFEPETAIKLLHTAERAAGIRKWHRQVPRSFLMRGKVSVLIACGGDGTVNLVGRAGLKGNLPVGILPMGKFNNIAKSTYKQWSLEYFIKTILNGESFKINCGIVSQQPFFGSVGLFFTVAMQRQLALQPISRFAFRWGQAAAKAIESVESKKLIIKIDAFRFEVTPSILSINLLPYSVGLPMSDVSIADDDVAEIIFDYNSDRKKIVQYVRQLYKKKYMYGSEVQLFRGQKVNIQPTKNEILYLDGELIDVPNEMLEIEILPEKLKVIC